jgi:hypothetical protein
MSCDTTTGHARVFELEQELVAAKVEVVAATKTFRTKLGTTTIEWVTSVASALVLLTMALSATVAAAINTVTLLAELVISLVLSIEMAMVSIVKMLEAMFIACATVWAIVSALLDDLTEIEEEQKQSFGFAPPPPSPVCPSPRLSSTELVSIFDVYKGKPYATKEEKREARITRRALRAYRF